MERITQNLELAIMKRDTGRVTEEHLIQIFQESIDNGDILEPGNDLYFASTIMPLIDSGVLSPSDHTRKLEQKMNTMMADRIAEITGRNTSKTASTSEPTKMLILNRSFRVVANLVIIAVYVALFVLVDNPWVRVCSVIGFAILIRALTLFAMTSSSDIPLSQRLTMPIVTLVFGSAIFGGFIGALYFAGKQFPSSQPLVKILIIVLMVFVALKSTFPLSNISDTNREIP